jgi:hypothetical protein
LYNNTACHAKQPPNVKAKFASGGQAAWRLDTTVKIVQSNNFFVKSLGRNKNHVRSNMLSLKAGPKIYVKVQASSMPQRNPRKPQGHRIAPPVQHQ